ncbi:unnamed protein product [Brugia pahangi]|uniref:Protein Wnt n=1 Tax=Brugia pahangi TaxID=6280 RepID=A0A0N4TA96_BRUPA|nr:unnamed protein product [Brugia pahangi]
MSLLLLIIIIIIAIIINNYYYYYCYYYLSLFFTSVLVFSSQSYPYHDYYVKVYLESSPDYCEPDPEYGILGTHGRLCNVSSHGIDGCDLMCCYRGFDTRVRKVMDRCNCKFHYCCRVICQPCEKIIEEHICK